MNWFIDSLQRAVRWSRDPGGRHRQGPRRRTIQRIVAQHADRHRRVFVRRRQVIESVNRLVNRDRRRAEQDLTVNQRVRSHRPKRRYRPSVVLVDWLESDRGRFVDVEGIAAVNRPYSSGTMSFPKFAGRGRQDHPKTAATPQFHRTRLPFDFRRDSSSSDPLHTATARPWIAVRERSALRPKRLNDADWETGSDQSHL